MKKILLVVLFIPLLASGALAAEYHPNSVLVVLDAPSGFDTDSVAFEDALMTQANSVAAIVGARVVNTFPAIASAQGKNIVHLVSETKSAEQLKAELLTTPGGLNVSLNYFVETFATPICNPDPRFPDDKYYKDASIWSMADYGLARKSASDKTAALWDYFTGDGSVVVAIIDTGVAYDHPDLAGAMQKDSYGNYGMRFYDNGKYAVEQHPSKVNTGSHGTLVAGVVGAIGNNKIGVVGAAWNVRMITVNVYTSAVLSNVVDIIRGIDYLVSEKKKGMNIRVANMSFGVWETPANMPDNGPFALAIKTMTDAGIVVIAAAGNNAQDLDNPTGQFAGKKPYPACFTFANILCVGAVGKLNQRAWYSNYGSRVDIWAPGGNSTMDGGIKKTILSTIPLEAKSVNFGTRGYDYQEGTSLAAPLVAGASALLIMGQRVSLENIDSLQHDKHIADQVVQAMRASLEDEDNDGDFTLNLYNAMVELNGGVYPFAPLDPVPVEGAIEEPENAGGGCETGVGALAIFAVFAGVIPVLKRKFLLLGILVVALFAGSTPASAEYDPHSVLIVLDVPSNAIDMSDKDGIAFDNALMTQANSIAALVGARVVNTYPAIAIETDKNIVHLRSETKSAEQLKEELLKTPGVLNVSFSDIETIPTATCDPVPRFPDDRYYKDGYIWAPSAYGLAREKNTDKQPKLWDYFTGDGSVVVAIIDTGVAYDHPDLAGAMKKDSNGNYGRHFYGNGQISEEQHPSKRGTSTHGTHVAGIVGAIGNNKIGVAGAAWNVGLLAVNIFTPVDDKAYQPDVIGGIGYVLNEKRKGMNILIANLSIGGWYYPVEKPDDGPYGLAIRALTSAGIIVVIAAGNDGENMDAPSARFAGKKYYPASFNFANVLCVGAGGKANLRAKYSNYGSRVDLWAPGGNSTVDGGMKKTILSTIPLEAKSEHFGTKGYDYKQGTSMATPLVSGITALLIMGGRYSSGAQSDKDDKNNADKTVNAIRASIKDDGTLDIYAAMAHLNEGDAFTPKNPMPVLEPAK